MICINMNWWILIKIKKVLKIAGKMLAAVVILLIQVIIVQAQALIQVYS